jgi:hypothetical protein
MKGVLAPMPAKTSEPQDQPAEVPHYLGHRERLRDRFNGAGPDALSDYELLEMVLLPKYGRTDRTGLRQAQALVAGPPRARSKPSASQSAKSSEHLRPPNAPTILETQAMPNPKSIML